MRLIGKAERALESMCKRAKSRVAFGKPIAEQAVTLERIAEARCMIEQARLLTLKAAYMMDTVGNKAARAEIAMIKVVAPNMALQVIDWAMQVHGGAGVSQDFPLAYHYASAARCASPTGRTRCTAPRSGSWNWRSIIRKEAVLFLKKKNQKDFWTRFAGVAAGWGCWHQGIKVFLLLFLQKKKSLAWFGVGLRWWGG